jgi:hypothetical protein
MTIPLKDARAAFAGFGAMTVRQEIIATQMRNVSPAGQAVANQKIDPTPTAINTRKTAVAATRSVASPFKDDFNAGTACARAAPAARQRDRFQALRAQ